MNVAGKKVLIAGGAGFIGTNLALALAERGAHLRLTTHTKPLQVAITGAETLAVDLRQPDQCARTVEGMDYVFLCAAHTSGAAVIRTTPLVHITPNVLINTLMLEAAHRAGVAKIHPTASDGRPTGQSAQFSCTRPGTRPKSLALRVTRTAEHSSTMAAMRRSLLPTRSREVRSALNRSTTYGEGMLFQ